jgi:hypothetical protein
MPVNRRSFIKKASLAAGMISIQGMNSSSPVSFPSEPNEKIIRVSHLQKPVAIAMRDFSWILRHHRYGEFENNFTHPRFKGIRNDIKWHQKITAKIKT